MITTYLEQRWFRWMISIMVFIPILVFEFYGMSWGGAAWLAVIGVAAVVLTRG